MGLLVHKIMFIGFVVGCCLLSCACTTTITDTGFDDVANEENDATEAIVEESDEKFITNDEPFIATNEWQSVKKGQAIPAGLHVQMNMQTNEVQAKLLNDHNQQANMMAVASDVEVPRNDNNQEDQERKSRLVQMTANLKEAMKDLKETEGGFEYWKDGNNEGMMNAMKKSFSREELKEALKNFKEHKSTNLDQQQRDDELRAKFRPIEELKEELKDLELEIKTDFEILTRLLDQYKASVITEQRVNILTDIEYYVHQIDNAVMFADIGGIQLVVKDLNSTEASVRSESAFVIGSAAQSNPKVQVVTVEAGALQQLVRMLPTEASASVRNRVMYAIAAILRNFPFAQERFMAQGGIDSFRQLFNEQGQEKLQIKAVTLLTDMMIEQNHAAQLASEEKQKQYARIPLYDAIIEQGWCDLIPSLLHLSDHDCCEKIVNSMSVFLPACQQRFSPASAILSKLKADYELLAKHEVVDSDDMYFSGLLKNIESLLERLNSKDEL